MRIETTRSPLWKDDPLENCITSQLVLRLHGDWDGRFDSKFNAEFFHVNNVFGRPYVMIPANKEIMASVKLHQAIKDISILLSELPFEINYSIL